jgi:hypothetical protein
MLLHRWSIAQMLIYSSLLNAMQQSNKMLTHHADVIIAGAVLNAHKLLCNLNSKA